MKTALFATEYYFGFYFTGFYGKVFSGLSAGSVNTSV